MAIYFLGESFETRGGALTSKMKLEIALRYLSDPGFQEGVAYDCGVHQTTVSKVISSTLDAISMKMDEWIKWPTTEEEMSKV